AEVPGVDAPGAVQNLGDRRPRCLGFREQRVDLLTGCDDLAEAEFATLRWPRWDPCVLGKLAAGVEGEDPPAVELEHGDCAGWVSSVTGELGFGHAGRLEAERTVEGKRPLQVVHGKGDHVDARFHQSLLSPIRMGRWDDCTAGIFVRRIRPAPTLRGNPARVRLPPK